MRRASSDAAAASAPRRARWWHGLALTLLMLVALLVAGAYWLSTQSALDVLLARAVARSEGRLSVEGATGSLLSTVHIDRLRWQGDEVTLDATGVALTWSPTDLLSRRFNAKGFGAQHLVVTLPAPRGGATALPSSLALPLEVTIAQAGIGRIDWRAGERSGTVTGLKFGYAGGATQHQISGLEVVSDAGTLNGTIGVGANAPFTLAGNVVFRGDGELRDTRVEGSVSGTLELFNLDAKVALRGATGNGSARLAPFAAVPVVAAKVSLADVDLRRFAAALPETRLDVRVDATPAAAGFAGMIEASNAQVGPIDGGRIPVSALHSRFQWTPQAIDLTELTAVLDSAGRGGTVSGNATYDLARGGARIDARLSAVDLRRIHTALITTALGGTLAGELDGNRQTLRGELAQGDLRFAFDATLAQRVVEVRTLRANAGAGELVARGRVALDGAKPFSVEGNTLRFNPQRFGDFPKAALNTTFKVDGALAPSWRGSGEVTLAAGSEVGGIAVSGSARGEIDSAPMQWRNVQAQARIAGGSASVSGSAGRPGDKLVFAIDMPELGVLRPLGALFPRAVASDTLPNPLRGALRATGSAFIQPEGSGIELDAHASKLVIGNMVSASVVDARASVPPAPAGTPIDARTISLRASATGLSIPRVGAGVASAASLNVMGTLARHSIDATLRARTPAPDAAAVDAGKAAAVAGSGAAAEHAAAAAGKTTAAAGNAAAAAGSGAVGETAAAPANADAVTAKGEEMIDARVAVSGGFQGTGAISLQQFPWPWSGSIDVAENKGAYALALVSPAHLEIGGRRVRLSDAHLRIAEGSADIGEFAWDEGRITSSGSFAAVPLATLARLAGRALPLRSTLTLKGDWSVAATPRLDGTLHVARDGGDVYATDADTVDPTRALGIAALDLSARFAADSVDARASMRSVRGGNAEATLTLAAVAGAAPGRLSPDAPLTAKVSADVVSLRPLQSWLGTLAALDGRAHVEVAATGTLARPQLSGAITADDVRIDLAQYGVQLKDGRLRARLAGDRMLLDEVSIHAGDGVFSAKGTIAASPGSGANPDVTWHAEHFRVVNRPDLRMVVAGDGTLRVISGKLLLAGTMRIEEGNVVYEATTDGRLADDVVVVGEPARPPSTSLASVGDLPLRLDIDVDLPPPGVVFAGEGLDTRLTGRVHLVTSASGTLNAKGTIRTRLGTYFALGQKLTIDRGALIFDGPVDNPALDVVALRKNLAVEAGLELTGTVRVPRVRLVSNPPVPDNEKLSWLVSGQPLDSGSRSDIALLASASASLLGKGGKPITQTIANTFGLDDISVRGSSVTTATGVASGQVVAFGKRLSDRLSLVYEQGLTIATNALRIEYTLTRTWTLRAEAGTVGSVGVYYRRSFD